MELRPELSLTAPTLRRALIAGARRVIASRDGLNRINVFPVADGDTGNNLASTLGSVLNGALSRRSRHAGELLTRVGDDAIDGARGNSGAILAQFLHGLAAQVKLLPSLDAASLAAAVRHGAASARLALAKPVEGTIVSVISAFAEELETQSADGTGRGSREGFARALVRARRALADTPNQLAVLQKAGVVDAGAQGFVDLLEGIAEFVEGGPRAIRVRHGAAAANEMPGPAAHGHEVDPQRRWCTECLVLGGDLEREGLRQALEAGGADSIVIAGGSSRMRVHAHAASPQAVFDACAGLGLVEAMKADDMLRQQLSAASGRRVAIVTDSAADLPEEIAERHAIAVVPARVELDGREYLDKTGLTTQDFYRRMADSRQLPRTSQPPPGDFIRQFELALAHHPQVVYVGLSSAVSGTLQSGEHAAARTGSGRAHAFDTLNAASGQALLVWRAAEMAQAGAGESEILAELERLRPQTLLWAITPDISHVVRGGRIPAWAAPLARLTALTPMARVGADGKLGICGVLFARDRAPEVFARRVARKLPARTRWRVIVGHCDAAAEGGRLLAALGDRIDMAESFLVETGAAIGAHAGRGALLVAVQPAPAS